MRVLVQYLRARRPFTFTSTAGSSQQTVHPPFVFRTQALRRLEGRVLEEGGCVIVGPEGTDELIGAEEEEEQDDD